MLGFQLKGSTIRKKIVEEAHVDKREIVKAFEGNTIKSDFFEQVAPLVIPLLPPHKTTKECVLSENNVVVREKTVDEIAAEEVLADISGVNKSNDSLLVIANISANSHSKAPLLLANQAPELLGVKDDLERFKVDLALRADDMDVKSEAYTNIPIEKFGEAMLRGMGWAGPDQYDDEIAKKLNSAGTARDQRLGLGATPKPPEDSKKGNKETREKLKNEWEKKAEEKVAKQVLTKDNIVWLRNKHHGGLRALVLATKGVPGLDKIRVSLEMDGEVVEVKRTDAILLSEKELEETPFNYEAGRSSRDGASLPTAIKFHGSLSHTIHNTEVEKKLRNKERDKDSVNCHRSRSRSRSGSRDEKKMKHAKHERHTEEVKISKRIETNGGKSIVSSSKSSALCWLRPAIRVKIVTKKLGDKYYLQKCSILDVYGKGLASVRLQSGVVLEDVKERYLETVLPPTGQTCVILRGALSGQEATLLERKEGDQVVVQLVDELEIHSLSADDVAAACTNEY